MQAVQEMVNKSAAATCSGAWASLISDSVSFVEAPSTLLSCLQACKKFKSSVNWFSVSWCSNLQQKLESSEHFTAFEHDCTL